MYFQFLRRFLLNNFLKLQLSCPQVSYILTVKIPLLITWKKLQKIENHKNLSSLGIRKIQKIMFSQILLSPNCDACSNIGMLSCRYLYVILCGKLEKCKTAPFCSWQASLLGINFPQTWRRNIGIDTCGWKLEGNARWSPWQPETAAHQSRLCRARFYDSFILIPENFLIA